MMDTDIPLVSLLTPAGRGAIASVAVVGASAPRAVSRFFRRGRGVASAAYPVGRILYGRWQDDLAGTEEVVVCRPAETRVEIHCHGGPAAARRIADGLVAAGCREVAWTALAYLLEPDALAAEARIALAAAVTERTAGILLDQYHGALRVELEQVLADLANDCAASAGSQLQCLLDRSRLGQHLTTPWRVVLAGAVNVGKSSLINRLLGYQRSIVFDQPGTTRDAVTARTAADGWPLELVDTAGLRATAEPLEAAGVALARRRMAAADLVVLVFDQSRDWSAADEALAAEWPSALIVHNKCDLPLVGEGLRRPGLSTSAATGFGCETVLEQIARRLVPAPPPSGAPLPFTARQVAGLEAAGDALAAGNYRLAAEALRRIILPAEGIGLLAGPSVAVQ